MKKNLVLYFYSESSVSEPYDNMRHDAETRQAHLLSCFNENINIFLCRYHKNYHGNNTFSPEFYYSKNRWIKIPAKKIYADLVLGFDFSDQDITNTYPNHIFEITKDKRIITKLFPHYCLESITCKNYEEIQDHFNTVKTELKVMKPWGESQGKGIFISDTLPTKDQFDPGFFPYLLQEFFDTSEGFYAIPGIHDFRVVILDGEIIGKILRQPKGKSYIANVARGGISKDLWDFDISDEMDKIIKDIDQYCSRYDHRYYSIDLGVGPNGVIKVFELNSAPALSTPHITRSLGNYIANHLL